MTAALISFAAVAALGLHRLWLAQRLRWMARHPAPTFVFADLVGYTALTARLGDEAAARVAREFRRTMTALSREHGAWQVKSMGDGAMIWAPDAAQAMALAARAVREVGTRADLLPVRVGAHTGPAVMQGGDWYGNAVNVAARLADEAHPNEALISVTTRSAAGELEWALRKRFELVLRGIENPVVVWRLEACAERWKDRRGSRVLTSTGSQTTDDLGLW
jgi:class 3 adenylate cyclase